MSDLSFHDVPALLSLAALCAECHAQLPAGCDASRLFRPAWPLDRAGPDSVGFFFDPGELDELIATRAGACFVRPDDVSRVPSTTIALITGNPLDAFRRLTVALQTEVTSSPATSSLSVVHVDAHLEQGVKVGPNAVVGPRAEIGAGTTIGANSVVGAGVRIGRGCWIDNHVSVRDTLIGDRVVVHAGARIGMATPRLDAGGRTNRPRLGRVIIQDDVEIGANVVVDRGVVRDTMIGDGVRIAALIFVEGGRTIDRHRAIGVQPFSLEQEMG